MGILKTGEVMVHTLHRHLPLNLIYHSRKSSFLFYPRLQRDYKPKNGNPISQDGKFTLRPQNCIGGLRNGGGKYTEYEENLNWADPVFNLLGWDKL
jgi:hypothetical protein